jgi:histidinol-phosphatase
MSGPSRRVDTASRERVLGSGAAVRRAPRRRRRRDLDEVFPTRGHACADEGRRHAEIAAAHPEHGILGEEGGSSAEGSRTRWILDPIDGTKNFSWGIPNWGTLIALEVDGDIVCGVASAPALGERYTAARGSGAMRNHEPIRVSDVQKLDSARLGFTSATAFEATASAAAFSELLTKVAHDRGIGDFYGHVLVASGALDAMVEPALNPWDIGPLLVIVEEAGGRVTDLGGRRGIYGGSCVTTNGALHEQVLRVFTTGTPPGRLSGN